MIMHHNTDQHSKNLPSGRNQRNINSPNPRNSHIDKHEPTNIQKDQIQLIPRRSSRFLEQIDHLARFSVQKALEFRN
jgi:hypothetical protein